MAQPNLKVARDDIVWGIRFIYSEQLSQAMFLLNLIHFVVTYRSSEREYGIWDPSKMTSVPGCKCIHPGKMYYKEHQFGCNFICICPKWMLTVHKVCLHQMFVMQVKSFSFRESLWDHLKKLWEYLGQSLNTVCGICFTMETRHLSKLGLQSLAWLVFMTAYQVRFPH